MKSRSRYDYKSSIQFRYEQGYLHTNSLIFLAVSMPLACYVNLLEMPKNDREDNDLQENPDIVRKC